MPTQSAEFFAIVSQMYHKINNCGNAACRPTSYPADALTFSATQVLRLCHVLHPLHHLAIQALLDGDMCHAIRRSGAVPVPLIRFKPNDVAGAHLLDLSAFLLNPPAA